MSSRVRARRGVASLIGTLFFVFIFMIAIGAQAYMSGLQSQSNQAAALAQQVVDRKGAESVTYKGSGQGLLVYNSGGSVEHFDAIILKFANGTVYNIPISVPVGAGGSKALQSMVPAGACGSTQCVQRFNSIVTGASQGSVGALTSLGNAFWYSPAGDPASGSSQAYWVPSKQSTSSTTLIAVSGLAFPVTPGGYYEVSISIGYYQNAQNPSGPTFAVSVPAGSIILACGQVVYPDATLGCTTSPNTSMGGTVFGGDSLMAPNYCNSSSVPCLFVGSVYVGVGATPGNFQLEFDAASGTTATVVAGSRITVVQEG